MTATITADPLLRCDNVIRTFGERTAVDGVSFHINRGETYGLLGPNGAGKTTTISMISGILAATSGDIVLHGEPIGIGACPAKSRLGLVPQEIALYDDLTAAENLRFFGQIQGITGPALAERVAAVLDIVALTDRANDRIGTYSGGMKRRINIAAGLIHQPDLLILDEPTVGVDPQSRNQILETIARLGTEGMSVLYTTHYMEEAEQLCDRIAIMDAGRIVAEGSRAELVEQVGEGSHISLRITPRDGGFLSAAQDLDGVTAVNESPNGVEILVDDPGTRLASIVTAAERFGVRIEAVDIHSPDLESVFLHLTGKALRD